MFDRFLGRFGLARRREVMAWMKASQLVQAELDELGRRLEVAEVARLVDERKFREREAQLLRQLEFVLEQYGKVSAW